MDKASFPWFRDPDVPNFAAARAATVRVHGIEPDMTREGGSIPITQVPLGSRWSAGREPVESRWRVVGEPVESRWSAGGEPLERAGRRAARALVESRWKRAAPTPSRRCVIEPLESR